MIKIKRILKTARGFTLIEILVVIGIIAVLAAVVLVAINPARQFKLARDSQRMSNVTAILNSVGQNMAENKGLFKCDISLPATSTVISNDNLDIAICLVPNYIGSLPFDPSADGARWKGTDDYDTAYFIWEDVDGRVTVKADGEITDDISVTR